MRTSIVELDADHPGFNDQEYRRRRDEIALLAMRHRPGDPPARVEYTEREAATWGTVFRELTKLYPTHACREYNQVFHELGYTADKVPQHADIDRFLQRKTGFRIQPVAGLVSSRDFLGSLARRAFPATQYIRHHSVPHYTPEPDVVHEMLGHVPMLADQAFADLTQKFGQASLDATDAQIDELSRLYWYTVEFGLVRQDGELRAYGAGLLSSFGELSRSLSGEVEVRKFDPQVIRSIVYPITTYQPFLFEVPSVRHAFERMDEFVRTELGPRQ